MGENPGYSYITENWNLHVISEGKADVSFRIQPIPLSDGSTTDVIFTAGFWNFDLEIVDINMDGRLDVLTTTWSQLGSPGALMTYEIPDNWQSPDGWTRHIIKEGYKMWKIPGKGS